MPTTVTKTVLFLNGLGCGGGGARAAERILAQVPGVTHAYVNPLTETAYVEHDPVACSTELLEARLRQAGFGATRRW